MNDRCQTCRALCCRYFCFQIDEPTDYDEFEDIRWYLLHQGVRVHIDEDGAWFIQIDNPCQALDANNRCTIYEDRPLICRGYSTDNCEATDDDYGYREEFTTPEQLAAYARRVLGDETYEKEMIKYRARAHKMSRKQMREHLLHAGLLTAIPAGKQKRRRTERKTER